MLRATMLQFLSNQHRVAKQFHDLGPDQLVQIRHCDHPARADRFGGRTMPIGAPAPVVAPSVLGSLARRTAVESMPTLRAHQKGPGADSASWCCAATVACS